MNIVDSGWICTIMDINRAETESDIPLFHELFILLLLQYQTFGLLYMLLTQ